MESESFVSENYFEGSQMSFESNQLCIEISLSKIRSRGSGISIVFKV